MEGGFGPENPLDAEASQVIYGQKAQLEARLGTHFNIFVPVSYSSQVVAGINYRFRVAVDNGKTVYATIFQDLPHNGGAVTINDASLH